MDIPDAFNALLLNFLAASTPGERL